jgi:hypothetical protein
MSCNEAWSPSKTAIGSPAAKRVSKNTKTDTKDSTASMPTRRPSKVRPSVIQDIRDMDEAR